VWVRFRGARGFRIGEEGPVVEVKVARGGTCSWNELENEKLRRLRSARATSTSVVYYTRVTLTRAMLRALYVHFGVQLYAPRLFSGENIVPFREMNSLPVDEASRKVSATFIGMRTKSSVGFAPRYAASRFSSSACRNLDANAERSNCR